MGGERLRYTPPSFDSAIRGSEADDCERSTESGSRFDSSMLSNAYEENLYVDRLGARATLEQS